MPAKRKAAIHTVPVPGQGWGVKPEGAKRVTQTFARKSEADAAAREIARRDQTEHISHRRDGTIGERRSYGNHPRRIPG